MKRSLTQRGQQHRDHGLDVPSPSAGNTNQQGLILIVPILELFSPTMTIRCPHGICNIFIFIFCCLLARLTFTGTFCSPTRKVDGLSGNAAASFTKSKLHFYSSKKINLYLQASSSGLVHLWPPGGHGSSHCTLQSSSSLHDI